MNGVSTAGFLSLAARIALALAGGWVLLLDPQRYVWAIWLVRIVRAAEETRDLDASAFYGLLGCITLVIGTVLLLSFATFLAWLWRAHRNVSRLGVEPASARHWVVTGFLVPGVNLVQPYHVVLEVWQQSDRVRLRLSDPSERSRATGIVTAWWSCLVTWAAGSVLVFLIGRGIFWFTAPRLLNTVQVILSVAGVAAAVLGILMIGRADRLQEEAYAVSRQEAGAHSPDTEPRS